MPENKTHQKIIVAQRKAREKKRQCFFLGCRNICINSHSQSKADALKKIAENGHVISVKHRSTPNKFYSSIGISEASTFKGFCNDHDHSIFKKIDRIVDCDLTKENITKLAFRTFAYEVRTKEICKEWIEHIARGVTDKNAEIFFYLKGLKNHLVVTSPYYQKKFMLSLTNKDYSNIEGILFKANHAIPISTSTALDVGIINSNDVIEEDLKIPRPICFFNIIPGDQVTYIFFIFFCDDRDKVNTFIKSNHKLEEIVFNYCEEMLLRPSFFDNLDETIKQKIQGALAPWCRWEKVTFEPMFNVNLGKPIYI